MSNRFKKFSSTLIAFAVAVSAMMFVSMWKTNAYADSDEEVYNLRLHHSYRFRKQVLHLYFQD